MFDILIFVMFWVIWWLTGVFLLKLVNILIFKFYEIIIKYGNDEMNEKLNKIM